MKPDSVVPVQALEGSEPDKGSGEQRNADGTWPRGTSGNPRGRPKGTSWHQRVRAELRANTKPILMRLHAQALAGDVQAARLLLDRSLAPLKHGDDAVRLEVPSGSSIADQARMLLGAIASGQITPGQGGDLMAALEQLARIVEVGELEARLTALEALRR